MKFTVNKILCQHPELVPLEDLNDSEWPEVGFVSYDTWVEDFETLEEARKFARRENLFGRTADVYYITNYFDQYANYANRE